MDREGEAETIVRDLLEGRKVESDLIPALNRANISDNRKAKLTASREGKLWCLLGDLALNKDDASRDPKKARENAIDFYTKAWVVSNHTSSRAMRSLGSLWVSGGEFEEAIQCLKAALDINPQYARVWFTLGVCFVRLERWGEARDAFRREVGVDEEDGEGWNNLAAVYLRLGEEGVPKGEVRELQRSDGVMLMVHYTDCPLGVVREQTTRLPRAPTGIALRIHQLAHVAELHRRRH
jgi:tetratricopeptide (TPR) repeat protein